jgi:cytochrome c oxidase cbb3-type subunit 4
MMGIVSGLMTGLLLILFIGIWIWAWSKRNKDAFDSMAQLPLEDGQTKREVNSDE